MAAADGFTYMYAVLHFVNDERYFDIVLYCSCSVRHVVSNYLQEHAQQTCCFTAEFMASFFGAD